MPFAVPLIDSSGASVLKRIVFTPFGSLKSNWIGAAETAAHKPTSNRDKYFVILNLVYLPNGKRMRKQIKDRQQKQFQPEIPRRARIVSPTSRYPAPSPDRRV